jgi:hypothetical protein
MTFEANSHVFIVRIWWESREIEGATPEWRGLIEHVPTRQRRYLRDLGDIVTFIGDFLTRVPDVPVDQVEDH